MGNKGAKKSQTSTELNPKRMSFAEFLFEIQNQIRFFYFC